MFNFRRDQNKFNNNGGYPSLGNLQKPDLVGGGINPGGKIGTTTALPAQVAQYNPEIQGAPLSTSYEGITPGASPTSRYGQLLQQRGNNPYQQLSRDRYLNENYRNPMRQRMGRIGSRRQRAPMNLQRMEEERRRRQAMMQMQRYGRYAY